MLEHWAVFTDNHSHTRQFVRSFLQGRPQSPFHHLAGKKGGVFSKLALDRFLEKEDRHGESGLDTGGRLLRSMSSGEQKRALLHHLLETEHEYLLLDRPFDNLDVEGQARLMAHLKEMQHRVALIQIVNRRKDILPYMTRYGALQEGALNILEAPPMKDDVRVSAKRPLKGSIPPPLGHIEQHEDVLVAFRDVSVSYGERPILNRIFWKIRKGEFWQLLGSNGSGKSTLLSIITGDNPKGYGQDICLFGKAKGSGESVWEIKQKIGYYSPAMTDKFAGRHTLENMLISGLLDSIGLYTQATEGQKRIAAAWLKLLGLHHKKDTLFADIGLGEQRVVMTARAMVKHPPLLILDEPTEGMDDASAALLVALVNKMAQETNTAIVFVSHREEPGLEPRSVFSLEMTPAGSVGSIL
ncbi:ATP-binding cassette domain-containing protein [Maribacter sp. 2307ULW6-5]|uniref:ATP-binding cassette domain-containing protein n=1 Tax=Maribacter sp. 2307ULW6-5 TaxID=3386275 RepID=UPI0039BCD017